jgi:hypothetical protein
MNIERKLSRIITSAIWSGANRGQKGFWRDYHGRGVLLDVRRPITPAYLARQLHKAKLWLCTRAK